MLLSMRSLHSFHHNNIILPFQEYSFIGYIPALLLSLPSYLCCILPFFHFIFLTSSHAPELFIPFSFRRIFSFAAIRPPFANHICTLCFFLVLLSRVLASLHLPHTCLLFSAAFWLVPQFNFDNNLTFLMMKHSFILSCAARPSFEISTLLWTCVVLSCRSRLIGESSILTALMSELFGFRKLIAPDLIDVRALTIFEDFNLRKGTDISAPWISEGGGSWWHWCQNFQIKERIMILSKLMAYLLWTLEVQRSGHLTRVTIDSWASKKRRRWWKELKS